MGSSITNKGYGASKPSDNVSYINSVSTSLLQDSTSCVSFHFVSYYIVVRIYIAPILYLGLEKVPTESIAHISNINLGFMDIKGISFCLRGIPILWQSSHLRSWDLQSQLKVGNHNLSCRIFLIIVST